MSDRVLLRGGYVLSMDDTVGELPEGDVLIEDGAIAAVEVRVDAEDAELVDVSGHVVMPGFVDTHRHTWQTPFRGVCADWTLEDYFRGIRMSISPNCSAEDVYAGNYVGALEALEAGVTTILDFSHCNNTPEHADGAIQGLRDAGIRAIFAYGYYPAPTAEPVFTEHEQRLADARRIRERELPSEDALVTMGVALTEVGLLPFEQTIAEARSARELGVPSILHTGCNWGSLATEGIPELDHHQLLSADQVHVHCNTLDERNLRRLAENDCKVSSCPETEIQMGMGHPVMRRVLELGMRPSLSCDVMSSNSGDMFAQMRHRPAVRAVHAQRHLQRSQPDARPPRSDRPRRAALGHRQRRARDGPRASHRLTRARQAGRRHRRRRAAAEHGSHGRSRRLSRCSGQPGQRRCTCWSPGALPSATASSSASTSIMRSTSRRTPASASLERSRPVIRRCCHRRPWVSQTS